MEEQSKEKSLSDSPEQGIELPEGDRLSELPDCLIRRILSLLPNTRDAIRTGVLSQRWRNQWRQVPVVTFDYLDFENHSQEIDGVLDQFECSKLEKFYIVCTDQDIRQLDRSISFAVNRKVSFLSLENLPLPEFLFSHALLVRLRTQACSFSPSQKVNWRSLKEFTVSGGKFLDRAFENVLAGCPLLESLHMEYNFSDHLIIASASLRKLSLNYVRFGAFGISCPNLEELRLHKLFNVRDPDKSVSPANVRYTAPGLFLVTSQSLRKLHVYGLDVVCLEIMCPTLEELELFIPRSVRTIKVVDLKPSAAVTLDSQHPGPAIQSMDFLHQLQHVKGLKFGRLFINALLAKEGSHLSTLLLTNKCLTLVYPVSEEIELVLRIFHVLEKLVFINPASEMVQAFAGSKDSRENYWLEVAASKCLVSHLKHVVFVFRNKRGCKNKLVLDFVEFLLKNARVLEKMDVVFKDCFECFVTQVSEEVAGFPRLSQDAVIINNQHCDQAPHIALSFIRISQILRLSSSYIGPF